MIAMVVVVAIMMINNVVLLVLVLCHHHGGLCHCRGCCASPAIHEKPCHVGAIFLSVQDVHSNMLLPQAYLDVHVPAS